jgi:hypothetical protein
MTRSQSYGPLAAIVPMSSATDYDPYAQERLAGEGVTASDAQVQSAGEEETSKLAGAALRAAVAQGELTQAQAEAVMKATIERTGGGAPTPEILTQEVTKQQIGQGLLQATGGAGAPSSAGSLIGVGLGGPVPGTGTVGGPMGAALQTLFGSPQLPPGVRLDGGGVVATPWLSDPRWQRAAGMMDHFGGVAAGQTFGLSPELAGIRRAIENTWLDARAREDVQEQVRRREWRREVLRLLWALYDQHLQAGYGNTLGARHY